MKKKLVFISNMAAPYQVKFCYALQKYFDTEFWFYVRREKDRPKWWEIPLGDKCKVMKLSGKLPVIGYYSLGLFADLIRFKPDIIYLGGFMKWHWLVLIYGKLLRKKVVIMNEPLRYTNSENSESAELRNRKNSKLALKIANKLFKSADLFIGMGETAVKQFVEEIGFEKEKCIKLKYPQDIEEYFKHPLRENKKEKNFRILFANRLIDRYQPLFVLEVFEKIIKKYPNTELYMNSEGPLKIKCMKYIESKNIKNVKFLDKIDSWNNMNLIYKDADILILPATYSNGNGTIIEARASGMGIVISNQINHIKEHSIDGKNCFICNLNVDEFVEGIIKYIENPELLIEHGILSRKLVENRKNENYAKEYYMLLKKHNII